MVICNSEQVKLAGQLDQFCASITVKVEYYPLSMNNFSWVNRENANESFTTLLGKSIDG